HRPERKEHGHERSGTGGQCRDDDHRRPPVERRTNGVIATGLADAPSRMLASTATPLDASFDKKCGSSPDGSSGESRLSCAGSTPSSTGLATKRSCRVTT